MQFGDPTPRSSPMVREDPDKSGSEADAIPRPGPSTPEELRLSGISSIMSIFRNRRVRLSSLFKGDGINQKDVAIACDVDLMKKIGGLYFITEKGRKYRNEDPGVRAEVLEKLK